MMTFVAAVLLLQSCEHQVVEPATVYHAAPEFKGFSYPSYTKDGFRRGEQIQSLEELRRQTGSDFVALSFFEFQDYDTSTGIGPNINGRNPVTKGGYSTSSTEADIEEAIAHARRNGMRVMLKPHVDLYSGQWRALIRPDDEGKWFESYTAMMTKYAKLAERNGVEMMCIGVEYLVATQPKYTPFWRKLIADIRKVYSGKLTYGANWSGQPQLGMPKNEFEQVEFWDDLDYIGLDAYYPLAALSNGDVLPEAVKRMQAHVQRIAKAAAFYNKKVVIIEAGIQSVVGALKQPYEFSLGTKPNCIPDDITQEFYYRAMIESFGRQPWLAGIFWWQWDSVPNSFRKSDYTVQDKSCADIVRQWYSGRLPEQPRLDYGTE